MDNPTTQAGAKIATCPYCGSEFERRHGNQKYCSNECQKAYKPREQKQKSCFICQTPLQVTSNGQKYCSEQCAEIGRKRIWRDRSQLWDCRRCGEEFRVYPSQVNRHSGYCSSKCRNADLWTTVTCGHCGKQMERRKKYVALRENNYCSNECRTLATRTIERIPCPVCGKMFAPVSKGEGRNVTYCSRDCYHASTGYSNGLEWAKSDDHTVRNCEECGVEFIQSEGSKRLGYCSTRCVKRRRDRMHSATRRLRITQAPYERIDPLEVYRRDKWICQLCGIRTLKRLRGTVEDRAPNMDHIIPLNQGGSHTWANVQCTCRKCNMSKGDKIIGQLRLA